MKDFPITTDLYSEKTASQQPALDLLQSIGYTYISPQDCEAQRGSRYHVLLKDILRGQLRRLNRYTFAGAENEFSAANIERAIKKGVGELGDAVFEEIVYEGYAPGGVAVMVECLTDNKNRSISDVRMVFDRNNGNMAGSGAVARMFRRQAHFVITGDWADEDKLMDLVLDAGANDLTVEDGVAEVWADPENFEALVKLFEEKGIPTEEAELIRRPDMVTEITDPAIARQVLRLVERMEELDDVQLVTANYEIADSIADQLEEE